MKKKPPPTIAMQRASLRRYEQNDNRYRAEGGEAEKERRKHRMIGTEGEKGVNVSNHLRNGLSPCS